MRSVSIKMIRLKSSNYGKDEEAGFSDKLVKHISSHPQE